MRLILYRFILKMLLFMLLTASVMSLSPSVLDADMASCASISSILVAWTEALKVFCALISENNFEKTIEIVLGV